MKEIKFRAVISPSMTITFTLQGLLVDTFSNRVILIPWLNKGNVPDKFTGLKDRNDREIFESDKCKIHQFYFAGFGEAEIEMTGVIQIKELGVWFETTHKGDNMSCYVANMYGLHEESFELID
jgi:hypothetical protein